MKRNVPVAVQTKLMGLGSLLASGRVPVTCLNDRAADRRVRIGMNEIDQRCV